MKQFLINSTSTLLSAATVLGIVVFAAAPARADTADVIKGLMAGIILVELANQHKQPQQQHTPHYNINNRVDPNRECRAEYRAGSQINTWERISYDCVGRIREVRQVR